jgi:hypothetical protein
MTEMSNQKSVTFAHPFSLDGVEGTFAPGTYVIEETREQVDGLSFIGYRRTKTTIELPGANRANLSRQLVEIEPADLAAALARDAEVRNGRKQV